LEKKGKKGESRAVLHPVQFPAGKGEKEKKRIQPFWF